MTKAVKEEKGKVPKSNRKEARDKSKFFLQRRENFPLGELRKVVRTKAGNVLGKESTVSLWRLSIKSREKQKAVMKKRNNYLTKEGAITKSEG